MNHGGDRGASTALETEFRTELRHLATKADLSDLKAELKTEIANQTRWFLGGLVATAGYKGFGNDREAASGCPRWTGDRRGNLPAGIGSLPSPTRRDAMSVSCLPNTRLDQVQRLFP